MLLGIAQKNGIAIRARKSGAGAFSVTSRWLPLTFTLESDWALPPRNSCAPTMSVMNDDAGDCIFGLASRFRAAAKLAAVTCWPFEKRVKSALTVKSYVRPLLDTFGIPVAASETSCDARGPFTSG